MGYLDIPFGFVSRKRPFIIIPSTMRDNPPKKVGQTNQDITMIFSSSVEAYTNSISDSQKIVAPKLVSNNGNRLRKALTATAAEKMGNNIRIDSEPVSIKRKTANITTPAKIEKPIALRHLLSLEVSRDL